MMKCLRAEIKLLKIKNKLKEDYTNLTKKNSIQGEIIGRLSNEKLELRNTINTL